MEDFLNRLKVISKKKKREGGLANNILYTILFLYTTLEKYIEFCQYTCKCLYEQVKKTSLLFTCIHSKGVMLPRNCFVFFNKTLFIILSGYIYIDSKAMGNK